MTDLSAQTDPAVELSGVSKAYPHFHLGPLDLTLEQGQIMGFIGANGAGKSTTIRILLGLVRQDAGSVRILGHPIPDQQVAAKWHVGFASEDMRLYPRATLGWHLRLLSSIFPSWDERYASHLLQRFDLRSEQKIRGLSHGQRVKASLLLVLARRPRLLLLDEPTTGLDPVARQEVLGEMLDVLADEERTVLFSSHNTADVERLSDSITLIDGGQIIASRDKESFLDRWRRLRLEVPPGVELPTLPSVVDIRKSGRLAVVTTDAYTPELREAYQSLGATVQRLESLSLEEIFVASTQQHRGRNHQHHSGHQQGNAAA